jgi:uncharacterized membrane protein
MPTFIQCVYVYLLSVPVFLLIDLVWLGFIAPGFYRAQIGHLLSGTVNWPPAIAFYVLFLVGLLIFAIVPAIEAKAWTHALIFGALFGFFTYMTYDLTNWATMKDWPVLVTVVDLIWGTVLSGAVATATYFLAMTFIIR